MIEIDERIYIHRTNFDEMSRELSYIFVAIIFRFFFKFSPARAMTPELRNVVLNVDDLLTMVISRVANISLYFDRSKWH